MPICPISPAAFMANSVSRCSRQSTKLCTCMRSKRGTPHLRRESPICSRPSPPASVQTLSAANTGGYPSFARPWPTVSWDEPYMGEESITVPPASKKAAMTATASSRSTGSVPTLKVIQVPRPTTGMDTPEDGITRVSSRAVSGLGAKPGSPAAAIAARPPFRMARRWMGIWLVNSSVREYRHPSDQAGFLQEREVVQRHPLLQDRGEAARRARFFAQAATGTRCAQPTMVMRAQIYRRDLPRESSATVQERLNPAHDASGRVDICSTERSAVRTRDPWLIANAPP